MKRSMVKVGLFCFAAAFIFRNISVVQGQTIDSSPQSGESGSTYASSTHITWTPEAAGTAGNGRGSFLPKSKPGHAVTIEGIQVSTEPGARPDERVITYYFIFRDKPSGYFHEIKPDEKKIVFEFNDTKRRAAPLSVNVEPPIMNFLVEDHVGDLKKKEKCPNPELHQRVRVTFSVSAIPKVSVYDEYNVISFSYTWSTDPARIDDYVLKDEPKKAVLWSSAAAAAGVGGGVLTYFLFLYRKPGDRESPISIDDLPIHD